MHRRTWFYSLDSTFVSAGARLVDISKYFSLVGGGSWQVAQHTGMPCVRDVENGTIRRGCSPSQNVSFTPFFVVRNCRRFYAPLPTAHYGITHTYITPIIEFLKSSWRISFLFVNFRRMSAPLLMFFYCC